MSVIFAVAAIAIFIYLDHKRFGVFCTPTVLLGGVYLVFIPAINILGTAFDFYPLSDETIFLFVAFLAIVFFVGQFFGVFIYKKRRIEFKKARISATLFYSERKIWLVYAFSLICYIISFIQVVRIYGLDETKSKAYGIFAHIGFLSRCLLPVIMYYCLKKFRLKYAVSILINLVVMVLFKNKYHLFIPMASFIVLLLITKRRIKLKTIAKIVAIAFIGAWLFFVSLYTLIPNLLAGQFTAENLSSGISFSTKHFFYYIFAPFICSNDYFLNPVYRGMEIGLRTQFNPIDVLYQQFFGVRDFFSPAIDLWPIVETGGKTANIGGIFSESVLNVGYVPAILYVAVIAIATYAVLVKTVSSGKRTLTALCLLGMLTMSFFCNFFTLFANFECLVYCYLLDVLIFDKIKKKRRPLLYDENQRRNGCL